MGFFFRKSINFGPLRFNLSKSGVGVSAGVKGARVSTGSRGTQIHLGGKGVYYQKTLSRKSSAPKYNPYGIPEAAMSHTAPPAQSDRRGIIIAAGLVGLIAILWASVLFQVPTRSPNVTAPSVNVIPWPISTPLPLRSRAKTSSKTRASLSNRASHSNVSANSVNTLDDALLEDSALNSAGNNSNKKRLIFTDGTAIDVDDAQKDNQGVRYKQGNLNLHVDANRVQRVERTPE